MSTFTGFPEQSRTPHTWLGWVIVAFLGVLLSAAWSARASETPHARPAELQVGAAAPTLDLRTPSGEPISLSDFRGQTVLVNFWATWCVPCRAELPTLQAFADRHAAQGFTVLTVNMGEDAELVQRFSSKIGVTLPSALDPDGQAAEAYRVINLPASFLIDAEGNLVSRHVGYLDAERIAKILREAGIE